MDAIQLAECCKQHRISARKTERLRYLLLQHIKDKTEPEPKAAPFPSLDKKHCDFKKKKEVLSCLIDDLKELVYDESRICKLKRFENFAFWMTDEDFKKAEQILEERPSLLIAGCTSSGKSTFVNALLGQSILPTAHSAATRIACEIKYGEKKQARIHSHCSGQSEVTWDLETKTQRKEFQSHVKGTVALKGSKGNGSSSCTCSKLEVFWPVDFLKDFTLVDSPGVTETEELVHSASCQITQDYLDGKICGFIFVLDSARSAEEASQAGGLLLPMPKDIFNRPAVESVLFVANKWDQIEEKVEEELSLIHI